MRLEKIDKEKKRNIITDIDDKMIIYRTKYYAAADFINNAALFAKKRKNLINVARKKGNHSLADALQNATDNEFAAYLKDRDNLAKGVKNSVGEVKHYLNTVGGAMNDLGNVHGNGFRYRYKVNGMEDQSPEFIKVRKLVGSGAILPNGKETAHVGQSGTLKNNLKSIYRNNADGDFGNLFKYNEKAGTAVYQGDLSGAQNIIRDLKTGKKHYTDFLSSNSELSKIGKGGTAADNLINDRFTNSVKDRQAAAAKAEQERAARAAEEQRKAAEQAKRQQQEAEEQARKEAREKAAEEQRRAEKEARERRQQAEAASREKEEQRRQEHLDRVRDRSQRKGLYTGLGIAGGVGAVGAGAYYLANRNNRRDDR